MSKNIKRKFFDSSNTKLFLKLQRDLKKKPHTDPKFQMETVLLVNGLNFDSNIILWQEMKCDGIK